MLGRRNSILHVLSAQHGESMGAHRETMGAHRETMTSLEEMREENKARHQEWRKEMERREAEWKAYSERREAEGQADLARRDEEMREFNREILLRNEKVYTAVLAEIEESCKQLRANTAAVLSVLDRLDRRDAA